MLVLLLALGLAAPALARPDKRRSGASFKKAHLQRKAPRPVDGAAFCDAAINRIARRTARGKRTCVVFDIDNTLVDTRQRTRAAARAFGAKARGRVRLSRLSLGDVGYDGLQTATRQGYKKRTAGAFQQYWRGFFWNSRNFKHDAAIPSTVDIARRAKAAGAEVFYLTGRIDKFHQGTVSQLRRLALPDADKAHVICKPSTVYHIPGKEPGFTPTAPFKVKRLQQLRRKGFHVGLFLSDAATDIAAVQQRTPISCVKIDFPVGPRGAQPSLKPNTPTIRIK